jgi:uracil-DNA glycosylase
MKFPTNAAGQRVSRALKHARETTLSNWGISPAARRCVAPHEASKPFFLEKKHQKLLIVGYAPRTIDTRRTNNASQGRAMARPWLAHSGNLPAGGAAG